MGKSDDSTRRAFSFDSEGSECENLVKRIELLKLIKVKFGSKIPINCNSWDDVIDQLGLVDSKKLQFCIEKKSNPSGMVRGLKT